MKKKLLNSMRLFLVAALLGVGASAWAETTIGSTSTGWGEGITSAYTLPTGKTLTFTFTVDASAGTEDYQGYVAILAKTSASTWGENQYLFLRSACDYAIGGTWNTGALYNTNTYGETSKVTFFTGATVNMAIKRIGTNVLVTTAITKSETTYYHYYQQNLGTADDVYAFLAAEAAQLTITGDAITDNGLTEETYDFVTPTKSLTENVASSSVTNVNVNGTSCGILKNTYIDMHDRFAGQISNEWLMQRNNCLYLASSGNRQFGILKLHAGDIVTITFYDVTPTFSGTPNAYIANDGDIISGTSLISGAAYTIKADGQLNLNSARYIHIQNITIHTAYPVMNTPVISFNSMVESSGLYYPKITFSSGDDGAGYVDGSGNDITSGYTFMGAGTLSVYAIKDGRTKSAEVKYTVSNGWILANSVNCNALSGTIDYSTGAVFNTGRFDDSGNLSTCLIPGLAFSSSYWYRDGSSIYTGSGARNMSCTVLNENRIAVLNHYYYSSESTINDYLTTTNNSVSISRQGGSNAKNDRLYKYDLYVNPSEEVSVTIGATGYSTFSSPVPLDFSGVSGLTAYVAKSVAGGNVTLSSVTTAPANTGLVLAGTAGETYNIPVTASAETPASNLLVGCIVNTAVAADATSKFNNYVLVNEGGTAKFQSLVDNGATVTGGKAFLRNGAYSVGARSLNIVFDDETTAIQTAQSETVTANGYYNLSGQRISLPTKGFYIVNGKKVIVK
ncbi:MAG: hypothetical protein IJ637_00125 [Prevotella sp.]|nr:hypothetical protein [Prevotella sp.]